MKKMKAELMVFRVPFLFCLLGFILIIACQASAMDYYTNVSEGQGMQPSIKGKWKLTIFKTKSISFKKGKELTGGIIEFDDSTFLLTFNSIEEQPEKNLRKAGDATQKGTYKLELPKKRFGVRRPTGYLFMLTMIRPNGRDFLSFPEKYMPNSREVIQSDVSEGAWEFTYLGKGIWYRTVWVFEKLENEKNDNQDQKGIEIKLGMLEEEVISILGVPNKKAVMENETKYLYSDTVITFINGKVSDIQFK